MAVEQIELTGRGEVFNAPTDVELSRIDIVVPDLLVILNERASTMGPGRVFGAPNLVVEILSPSTSDKDQRLKFDLYQKSGVPEYWIVDPDNRHVRRYLLADGSYRHDGDYPAAIELAAVPGVTVNLDLVW